jgi:hypothetical protein
LPWIGKLPPLRKEIGVMSIQFGFGIPLGSHGVPFIFLLRSLFPYWQNLPLYNLEQRWISLRFE